MRELLSVSMEAHLQLEVHMSIEVHVRGRNGSIVNTEVCVNVALGIIME